MDLNEMEYLINRISLLPKKELAYLLCKSGYEKEQIERFFYRSNSAINNWIRDVQREIDYQREIENIKRQKPINLIFVQQKQTQEAVIDIDPQRLQYSTRKHTRRT